MVPSRQLAAIMFMDIAGYTALMGENEEKALNILNQFKSIAAPLVEESGGKWLKDLGDGALCSFGSALGAVKSAIAVQQLANKELAAKVRIGIHLGDVVFQDGDVFGDGVNIAARLESEAAPGGICISEPVYKSVRNNDGIQTAFLGKRKLKNVEGSTGIYQVTNPGIGISSKDTSQLIPVWKALVMSIVLALVVSAVAVRIFDQPESAPAPVARLDIILPDDIPLALIGSAHFGAGQTALALSPDGKLLVYAGQENGTNKLYLRYLDSYESRALDSTEGAYSPFFSPDGQWIGFFTAGYLQKVSIRGGSPLILCEASNPNGAVWTPDGRIIFSDNEGSALRQVYIEDNSMEEFIVQEALGTFGEFNFPAMLGEKHLIVSRGFPRGIYAISLETGEEERILNIGGAPDYLPTGHLVFVQHGQLMGIKLDLETRSTSGEAIPIIDDLRTEASTGQYAVSNNGTLIYVPGISSMKTNLVLRSLDGVEETIPIDADYFGEVQLSPDGNYLAITNQNTPNMFSYHIPSKSMTRLTDEGINFSCTWGPGDTEITYNTLESIKKINASGTGSSIDVLSGLGSYSLPFQWSKDRKKLMYGITSINNYADIKFHHLDDPNNDQLLTPDKGTQTLAKFSPNSDYVAYTSDESGVYEIYVQPFPLTGERWTVSSGGGEEPVWSPDGKFLYYRNGNDWMAVEITTEPKFSIVERKLLFHGPYNNVPGFSYDITPDGQRFLLHKPVSGKRTAHRLKVIKNWFQEFG